MTARPFDKTITAMRALIDAARPAGLPVDAAARDRAAAWPQVGDHGMILRSDMAFELGDGTAPAIGCTVITGSRELVPGDALRLIGPDLPAIAAAGGRGGAVGAAHGRTVDSTRAAGDCLAPAHPFARIALVRVSAGVPVEGQALYRAIRDLEHVRYRFYPEGFMLRVSARKHRECVRVSRDALARGLTLSVTGNQMIAAFHKNPQVEAIDLTYITDPAFDYPALDACVREAEGIVRAIDHIMATAVVDCDACGLQNVCNEVEGLRELHFRR